jgi:hypothetical protein
MSEIKTEFDAAVATARHALEQFNKTRSWIQSAGDHDCRRGGGYGSRQARLPSAGTGSYRPNRSPP